MAYNVEPLRLSSKGPFELLLVLESPRMSQADQGFSHRFHGAVVPQTGWASSGFVFLGYEVNDPNDQYPRLMKQYKLTVHQRFDWANSKNHQTPSNTNHFAPMSGRGHA